MLTRKELLVLAETDPTILVDMVLALQEQVQALQEQVHTLQQRVAELESRLNTNSANSNKPPSSDGLAKPKPKTLRKRTGRKPGGQPGHRGHTLKQVDTPDHVIALATTACACGATALADQPVLGHECRQVFELPAPKLEVTEYRAEIKRCPCCGKTARAPFPDGVTAPTQYGPRFRAWLVYLHHQQLLPANRVRQLCEDLFGQSVSEAVLFQATQTCFDQLDSFEAAVIDQLRQEPILNADESGVRAAGKLHWLHVACTDRLTFYGVHEKRGQQAMDHFGILAHFGGRLVHDFWKTYFRYDCDHGLCNEHLLRELKFLHEEHHQTWAGKMSALLLDMKAFAESEKPRTAQLTETQKAPWLARYRTVVAEGRAANPLIRASPTKGKRGRRKQTKAQNLLDRLQRYESSVLAFLHDLRAPFTNNQAERDIRMLKVRQKISGCFRTLQGAKHFARIRSYLSTARKHGLDLLLAVTHALNGQPFVPPTAP